MAASQGNLGSYLIIAYSLPLITISNAHVSQIVELQMNIKPNITINGFAKAVAMGAIISLVGLSSASARARENYSVDRRVETQHQHLDIGLHSGQLTSGEATRIQSHLSNITNTIQADRAANGGRLTQTERQQMVREQNAAAQKIFQLKHNQNTAVPDRQVDRMNREKQLVQQGIQNGQLTKGEVAQIKTHEENIKDNLQKAASSGGLTKAEMQKAQAAQKRAARKIYQLKHNNRTQGTGTVSTAASVSTPAVSVSTAPRVSTPPAPQD